MEGERDFTLLFTVLLIYFFPVIIARMRSHRNTMAIAALNLLAGWTLLGWLVALVWALANPARIVVVERSAPTDADDKPGRDEPIISADTENRGPGGWGKRGRW